jgi:hypothetical protein
VVALSPCLSRLKTSTPDLVDHFVLSGLHPRLGLGFNLLAASREQWRRSKLRRFKRLDDRVGGHHFFARPATAHLMPLGEAVASSLCTTTSPLLLLPPNPWPAWSDCATLSSLLSARYWLLPASLREISLPHRIPPSSSQSVERPPPGLLHGIFTASPHIATSPLASLPVHRLSTMHTLSVLLKRATSR